MRRSDGDIAFRSLCRCIRHVKTPMQGGDNGVAKGDKPGKTVPTTWTAGRPGRTASKTWRHRSRKTGLPARPDKRRTTERTRGPAPGDSSRPAQLSTTTVNCLNNSKPARNVKQALQSTLTLPKGALRALTERSRVRPATPRRGQEKDKRLPEDKRRRRGGQARPMFYSARPKSN